MTDVDLNLITERLNELGYAFEFVNTGGGCIYPHFYNADETQTLVISDADGDSYSLHLYHNDGEWFEFGYGVRSKEEIVVRAILIADLMRTRNLTAEDLEEHAW